MRKTVYLSLVTLGVASIATAAVMTTSPSETPSQRRVEARAAGATHETRAVEGESEKKSETKRECSHDCWFSSD